MLHADQVAEPADCHGAAPEVSELPCAVQAGGVPVNVVVDMPISRMGADDEGMVDLAELLGKFIVRRVRGTGDGSDKLTHPFVQAVYVFPDGRKEIPLQDREVCGMLRTNRLPKVRRRQVRSGDRPGNRSCCPPYFGYALAG